MSEKLRGIFPVLQTPLDAEGEIDFDSLRKEVDFCFQTDAHGLVFPVLGSEFQFFSDRERRSMVEAVVDEAAGRIPVVAGVAGTSTPAAVEHARHAAEVGADAVIALPPYLSSAPPEETVNYYHFRCCGYPGVRAAHQPRPQPVAHRSNGDRDRARPIYQGGSGLHGSYNFRSGGRGG